MDISEHTESEEVIRAALEYVFIRDSDDYTAEEKRQATLALDEACNELRKQLNQGVMDNTVVEDGDDEGAQFIEGNEPPA